VCGPRLEGHLSLPLMRFLSHLYRCPAQQRCVSRSSVGSRLTLTGVPKGRVRYEHGRTVVGASRNGEPADQSGHGPQDPAFVDVRFLTVR